MIRSAPHRPETLLDPEQARGMNAAQLAAGINNTKFLCNLFNACWHLSRCYRFKLQMSNTRERGSEFRQLIPSCMRRFLQPRHCCQETAVCCYLWWTGQSSSGTHDPTSMHSSANPWRQLWNSENDSTNNMTSTMVISVKYTTSEQLLHKMGGERVSLSNTTLNWQTIYDGGLWEMD